MLRASAKFTSYRARRMCCCSAPVDYVTGDTPEGAWDALVALVERHGFTVPTAQEAYGGRGCSDYRARTVNIDPGMTCWSGCTSWSTSRPLALRP
jgi:hypothetical protein